MSTIACDDLELPVQAHDNRQQTVVVRRTLVDDGDMNWVTRLLVVAALLPLGGCQDYLFRRVCAEQIVEEEQTFAAATPKPADVLFIVDNSGSMQEEQQNLADNFDLFINQIAGAGDYRIAVVTTDQSSGEEQMGLSRFEFSDEAPFFARTTFDRGACSDTGIELGCFRGVDPAARIIDSSALSPADQVAFFRRNVQVGTCGSGIEQGLSAMESALSMLNGNQCNTGFLRDDANLVLIFVSDENDTDNTPVQDYVDFIGTVKPYEQIRVATIVGFADGEAADCRTAVDGAATAACGSICAGDGPPLGSQRACRGDDASPCLAGEICFDTGSGNECRDALWQLWNNQDCSSCSVFLTEDCCLADAGSRYVDFVRQLETRIANAAPGIEANGCQAEGDGRSACLLGSVCEASFGETLVRIARDLVIVNEYVLEPPAENPPGVRARIIGGRFGDDGLELEPGTDFVVGEANGMGVSLNIVNGQRIPAADEQLQIYYVSDIERGMDQRPGQCPDLTTTATTN